MKLKFCSLFIFITFLQILSVTGQTYALLDRRWIKPVILTDTIQKADLNQGLFPIYKNDIED